MKEQMNIAFTGEYVGAASVSLDEIIKEYKFLGIKLAGYADIETHEIDDMSDHTIVVNQLLDQQQALLTMALAKSPASLDDVKKLFRLWALEEVENHHMEDMSAAKLLAYKALSCWDEMS